MEATMDIFGPHAAALQLRAARNEVLATNLANSETPGYKARDIDFRTVLGTESARQVSVARTDARHVDPNSGNSANGDLLYRVPTQASLDGNTVEADVEQAQFAENVIQYRASLMFVNGKIKTLRHALTGER